MALSLLALFIPCALFQYVLGQGVTSVLCTSGSPQSCFSGQSVNYACVQTATFSFGTQQTIGGTCVGGIASTSVYYYTTPDGGNTFVLQTSDNPLGSLMKLAWSFPLNTAPGSPPQNVAGSCPAGANPLLVNPFASSIVASVLQVIRTMMVSNQTPWTLSVETSASAGGVVPPGTTQTIPLAGASASVTASTTPTQVDIIGNFIQQTGQPSIVGQVRASIIFDTQNSIVYYVVQKMLSQSCIQFFLQKVQVSAGLMNRARNLRRLLQTCTNCDITVEGVSCRGACIQLPSGVWRCYCY
eukprot:TRINITY_DN2248_c0_g1_i1.p1 TRINITY_DN2248_c0_g1~~TRINITY_DN2248_c0_g1_i1.p1  ORF type:complete len:298 (+),score=42.75 TRINITY_DN2248_c0_g1_i1:71-964(+)